MKKLKLTRWFSSIPLYCSTLTFEMYVVGGSMQPLLKDGDRVTVQRVDTYYPGDIVVFCHDRGLTVHRLLWQTKDRITCKGDSNLFCEVISTEDILGKVILIQSGDAHFSPAYGPLLAVLSYNKILIYKAHMEDKLSTRRDPAYVEIQHFLHGLRRNLIKNSSRVEQ